MKKCLQNYGSEQKINVDLIWFPFFITGKVLIVTGYPNGLKAEVIDLKSENSVCEELGDFPLQTTGAFGALLGNYPLVCGGKYYNKCYNTAPVILPLLAGCVPASTAPVLPDMGGLAARQ